LISFARCLRNCEHLAFLISLQLSVFAGLWYRVHYEERPWLDLSQAVVASDCKKRRRIEALIEADGCARDAKTG
jgi:hypothetical protein